MLVGVDNLITIVEGLLNDNSSTFNFKVYNALKTDRESYDVDKINGLAEVVSGGYEPISGLEQSSTQILVRFNYPVERKTEVLSVLQKVSQASAGYVVQNSTINENLSGTTVLKIDYPIQGTFDNDTLGETITSTIICYFVINQKIVIGNEVKIYINNGFYYVALNPRPSLTGNYYVVWEDETKIGDTFDSLQFLGIDEITPPSINATSLIGIIPTEISPVIIGRTSDDNSHSFFTVYGIDGGNTQYVLKQRGQTYSIGNGAITISAIAEAWYKITGFLNGTYTSEIIEATIFYNYTITYINSNLAFRALESVFNTVTTLPRYFERTLPEEYNSQVLNYYRKEYTYEEIKYYELKYNRTREAVMNNVKNSIEKVGYNKTQFASFNLAVPSIRNTVINSIKNDLMLGTNTNQTYSIKYIDESGIKIFNNMIASGEFNSISKPGTEVTFQISFIKRKD
jgi:hypothetical protein